jgi:hypothetical protein
MEFFGKEDEIDQGRRRDQRDDDADTYASGQVSKLFRQAGPLGKAITRLIIRPDTGDLNSLLVLHQIL